MKTPQTLTLQKRFFIEVAHFLPYVGPTHPCSKLHGHSMEITLEVRGQLNPEQGWVVDFGEAKRCFMPIYEQLDHQCLNSIPGLENPTSEHLAIWIWEKLKPSLPQLHRIIVAETRNHCAIFPALP